MLYSYDWYHLMFIFQVPYKKFEKDNTSNIYHIYIHVTIYLLQGENTSVSISVITHFLQGKKYNLFSAGGAFVHTKCHHQKVEECWNLLLMKTFVKPIHLELYHKPIQEFFIIKSSQRESLMICFVMIN